MGAICPGSGDSGSKAESAARPPVHIAKMHPAWNSEKGTEKITRQRMKKLSGEQNFSSPDDYDRARHAILKLEAKQAFDWNVHFHATELEKEATRIVKAIRAYDTTACYKHVTDKNGKTRLPAGHFLGNINMINESELLKVAREFPKGAHLHCHYNSCLPPSFLIKHARNVETMWIKSSCSLKTDEDKRKAEIQFQVQNDPRMQHPPLPVGRLMDEDYPQWAWQLYSEFREDFGGDEEVEAWLCSKMLLNEEEVYGIHQTVVE